MEHDIVVTYRSDFGGQVEEIFVQGRRVGMVYRDPKPPAEFPEMWMARTAGAQSADSREDAIAKVLAHAEQNPGYELR